MTTLTWLLEAGAGAAFVALLVLRLRRRRVVVERDGIVVVDWRGQRELWLVRARAAALQGRVRLDDPLVSGLPYTDGFHLYPPPPDGCALFVGAGAGIGPRQLVAFRPDARAVVVEPAAAVLEVARAQFGLEAGPRLELAIADGRAFLERDDGRRWDLIVIDAFGAGFYPGRLATVEAFGLCRARLIAGGVLAVNLAGRPAGPRLPAVLAGIVEVFGAERTRLFGVPPWRPARSGNMLAFAFVDAPREPELGADPRLPWREGIAALRLPVPALLPAPLRDAEVEAEIPIG
jgi:hypothetical protein